MKVLVVYVAIFAAVLIMVPMIALNYQLPVSTPSRPQVDSPHLPVVEEPSQREEQYEVVASEDMPEEEWETDQPISAQILSPEATDKGVESFQILDETTGKVTEVSLRDFVRGAVAAEMPANFEPEALKAQAVAAHTFALHNHLVQQETPDPALKGADFSADPSNLKVYMTEAQALKFYGEGGETYWEKVCAAADSVLPYVLEYEDQPIVAAYHAISAGQTEDAANVWIGSAPYLQPVDSEGDTLAADFESTVTIPQAEIVDILTANHPDITLTGDPEDWFGDSTRSGSGYVLDMEVGGLTLEGKELRELLDLRSHNFDVQYSDDGFVFQVYGYGHGVGLSQNGANYLATQGKTFDQILATYYTGATLKEIAPID